MRARGRVASRRAPIEWEVLRPSCTSRGGDPIITPLGTVALLAPDHTLPRWHISRGFICLGYGNNADASGVASPLAPSANGDLADRRAGALAAREVRRARRHSAGALVDVEPTALRAVLHRRAGDGRRQAGHPRAHPRHVVAFDIVFESRGNETAWHTDYESLGPFVVRDALVAMRDRHFVSVHFNLTKDGGPLTCDSPTWLSWLTYRCIVAFGIYSTAHALLTRIASPFLAAFASTAPTPSARATPSTTCVCTRSPRARPESHRSPGA